MRPNNRILLVMVITVGLIWMVGAEGAAAKDVLQIGSRSPEVAVLQHILVERGYDLSVDGVFGRQTQLAVRQFQRKAQIQVDGRVGPETWSVLVKGLHASPYGSGGPSSIYTLRAGDSLWTIARQYDTTVQALSGLNKIVNPARLQVGQVLDIPFPDVTDGLTPNAAFQWPVQGPITSPFGPRVHPVYGKEDFHGGIDIGVVQGTPVEAAADGVVISAGDMGAFGVGVVLSHGHNITTWYGHNSRVLVREGQRVRQGQMIALSGSTGLSTGPHLDFRIKVDRHVLDPQRWLP